LHPVKNEIGDEAKPVERLKFGTDRAESEVEAFETVNEFSIISENS
jgi:hypothetical protein